MSISISITLRLVAFMLCAALPNVSMAYWAKLDTTNLKFKRVHIVSQSDKDLRCSIKAFSDRLFIEVKAKSSTPTFNLKRNVIRTDLSLHCKPIDNATRTLKPWRRIRHVVPYTDVFEFI